MSNQIIKGSENWVKDIPEKHAIKCVEQYKSLQDERDRVLKFVYVEPICRGVGHGFVEVYGIINVPINTEGIVVVKNDFSEVADIYFREDGELTYGGPLSKCASACVAHQPPEFSEIFHYSERDIEREKSDENAPEWLKELARENSANVAYFEF